MSASRDGSQQAALPAPCFPDVQLLSVASDAAASSIADSRPMSAVSAASSNEPARESTQAPPASNTDSSSHHRAGKQATALGKKGTLSAPGGSSNTAAAAAAAGGGGGGAKLAGGKTRAVVSAGRATAAATAGTAGQATGGQACPLSMSKDPSGAQLLHEPSVPQPDPALPVGGDHTASRGELQSNATTTATAAAALDGGQAAAAGVILHEQQCPEAYEAGLPAGGPSSLLQSWQQPNVSARSIAAAAAAGEGGQLCDDTLHEAVDCFKVTPDACVVPAGQQQRFVVTFCSQQATPALQHLVLRGKQEFCSVLDGGGSTRYDASASPAPLRLHLLPWRGGTHASQQQRVPAPAGPLQCCIAGAGGPELMYGMRRERFGHRACVF